MIAQLAGAVDDNNCISAEGQDSTMYVLDITQKKSDGEAPVILELWGMWNIPSLPLLPGPLCLGVVAPDRVLSMGQIELFEI